MTSSLMRSVPAFLPDALVASQVGTWETDFSHDRTVCDEITAKLFGVEPEQAAVGLPLASFSRAIHPQDLPVFEQRLGVVREQGGLFVVEYRTQPAPGRSHWLLVRGRYAYDPGNGGVIGRGIVIDITESKLDGSTEDRAFFIDPHVAETPLQRAAGHAVAARHAIDETRCIDTPALRRSVDALLLDLGRALARSMSP